MYKLVTTPLDEQKLSELESKFINKIKGTETEELLTEIVKLVPNDFELGAYLRGLALMKKS